MRVERFRSMGCEVVVGGAGPSAFAAIRALFEQRDATFSRFRPGSELCRVNEGSVSCVSADFARALRVALAAADATDGLVTPAVGGSLLAAGYDRDFAELRPDAAPSRPAPVPGWRALRVAEPLVHRPHGLTLDLNGIVKSLTADDALRLVGGDGFVGAGGDLAVRGRRVVSLPGGAAVAVDGGGIATSGSATRRWLRGGDWQHHLVDPRSGRPSTARWTHVTVAARDCLTADVAAKAAFLLDADGPDWLDERRLAGRFVTAGGAVVRNAAWSDALDTVVAA